MKLHRFLLPGVLLPVSAAAAGRACQSGRYRITAPNGVQRAGYVPLGGIRQYVQVRSWDAAHPVLLVLHGGPGSPMSDWSYGWQAALERACTVVHWDQRGCGNTYFQDPGAPRPTLERLLSDLDELVDLLRADFGVEKVVLLGHSWGTYLGALYAAAHPEKVSAYVGVSQMVDFRTSERVSAREAVRRARAAGRTRDAQTILRELEQVLDRRTLDRPGAQALLRLRQHKERYLPEQYGSRMLRWRLTSPYLTPSVLRWMVRFDALVTSSQALYEALLDDHASLSERCLRFEVPVLLVAGEHDWTTPHSTALAYFEALSAPRKKFLTIAGAGHLPFADQPEAFSAALLSFLSRL